MWAKVQIGAKSQKFALLNRFIDGLEAVFIHHSVDTTPNESLVESRDTFQRKIFSKNPP